jgi:hypothetical protein
MHFLNFSQKNPQGWVVQNYQIYVSNVGDNVIVRFNDTVGDDVDFVVLNNRALVVI